MLDLGARFPIIYNEFEKSLGSFSTRPLRTEVQLWNILLEIVEQTSITGISRTSPLDLALAIIEKRLEEPLNGSMLAKEVRLSQNHLIRLFRGRFAITPHAYIRKRRAERARHLLVYSTLPIKVIAAQVGIPDLHAFNKSIRQLLGKAPREIRQTSH